LDTIDKQLVANKIYIMKLPIPSPRSALAVFAGLFVTVALALAAELTIVASNNGIATLQMMRLNWVLDVFAAVLGGYVAAQIADHSPIKHAMAVAALLLPPVAVLGLLSAEPLLHVLVTSLGLAVCILLGAISRDWQRRRRRPA
jgi:hypothetical protein